MTDSLFRISSAVASALPALKDHLWQSTLFLLVTALLALALRQNHARIRYWLWLAASIKFLVPFSLLVFLGGHLAPTRPVVPAPTILYSVIEEISQPFTKQQPIPAVIHRLKQQNAARLLSALLATIWLIGFLVVLSLWLISWKRVSAAMLDSAPLTSGREWTILRRLESRCGIHAVTPLLLSRVSLEPGIFGIFRPVLIWPSDISQKLDDAHLEAILAHEICHIRSRDNLVAAMHMFVEAIFWFHPLVWWLEIRLVEERERACDEEVVRLCQQPNIYAESILRVCEFCVESPLRCVSGVTGANLRKRIANILTARIALRLNPGRKLLLLAAASAAIAIPIIIGITNSPVRAQTISSSQSDDREKAAGGKMRLTGTTQAKPASQQGNPTPLPPMAANANPSFEVATIKPGDPNSPDHAFPSHGRDFSAKGTSVQDLILFAYGVHVKQIAGGPDWLNKERFDIAAVPDVEGQPSIDQWRIMVQKLMASRFHLTFHHEKRELDVFLLAPAKSGPKLTKNESGDPGPGRLNMRLGHDGVMLAARNETMTEFTSALQSAVVDRPVLDRTGITGRFDLQLTFAPDGSQFGGMHLPAQNTDSVAPSLFTALQETMGLKLESTKAPVDTLVIDHLEKPSEN